MTILTAVVAATDPSINALKNNLWTKCSKLSARNIAWRISVIAELGNKCKVTDLLCMLYLYRMDCLRVMRLEVVIPVFTKHTVFWHMHHVNWYMEVVLLHVHAHTFLHVL
jgi:hypothetical protein